MLKSQSLRTAEHSLLATPKHFAAYGGVSGGILASVERFGGKGDFLGNHISFAVSKTKEILQLAGETDEFES